MSSVSPIGAFRGAAVAALAAALAIAVPSSAPAQESPRTQDIPSVEQLVNYFDTIVFGSEFEGIKASPFIRKWNLPLRVVAREYGEIVSVTSGGREIRRLEPVPVTAENLGHVQTQLNALS
ncbi:MAG: hypothetical protein VW338_11445 [Rhodospirillaceae bacterium]